MTTLYCSELARIIEQRDITSLFQPIIDPSKQQLIGFEALSRGPEHSKLHSPIALFAEAARTGRLAELELLCRHQSMSHFANQQLPGLLFINISPQALLDPNYPRGRTLSFLRQLGIRPQQIVIEISEKFHHDDVEQLRHHLAYYRQLGCQTAIDDLGAGYSGLMLWSSLVPDYVKLDRHFIEDVDCHPIKRNFVRAMVQLASELGCKVIAEGVERPEELAELQRLGINIFQGYLLGHPTSQPQQDLLASA